MRRIPKKGKSNRYQRGAALLIALLMLVVLLMLGIAAVRIGLQSEKISRNWRDRQIAWQAAEAALLDAEYDVRHSNAPHPAPSAMARNGMDYGGVSGHIMQTGIGVLATRLPRYLIETIARPADQPATDKSIRYRISVIGFGPDPNTRIMLQSIYRHQAVVAGAPATIASMRLSWREIAMEEAL
jgi:type IV pilus assembly protein PilX